MERKRPLDSNERRRIKKTNVDAARVREWCTEIGVDPDAGEAAYRECVDAGLLRGRYVKCVQAGAIYLASRRSGDTTTIRRVARLTGERLVNVRRVVMAIYDRFGLPPQMVKQYVESSARRLGLEPDYSLIDLDALDRSIGAPMRAGIALRIMSCAAGTPRSVEEVAEAVGLNPKSLRNYVTPKGDLKPEAMGQ